MPAFAAKREAMQVKFIPPQALANRKVFAQYMSGDASYTGFSPGGTVAPYVSEELRRDPWVWFGTDNLWPERLRELVDNCIPLSRCADMGALFIAGMGVKFMDENGEPNEDAQERFQEWVSESSEEEFMERISSDVSVFNSFSYDVTPLGDEGRRVGRIRHRDVMRVRLEKADEQGRITGLWWSPDWRLARTSRTEAGKLMAPVRKEMLDLSKRQKIATAYVRGYKQGKDYYGEPWWISGITDAENFVEVGRFNNAQLRTGFRGAMHMHFLTERDEGELDKLYDGIVANYTGSMGEGLFLTFGRAGEEVKLMPVPRGDHAGELDLMRKEAENAIVRAYGIAPILYGADNVKTGMDGAGSALQQAMEQWQRTWVEPRQKLITRELTRLMIADGIDLWDTVIEPLKVVDPKSDEVQDRQAYLRAVTVNEHRVNRLGLEEMEGGEALLISAGAAPGGSADGNNAEA